MMRLAEDQLGAPEGATDVWRWIRYEFGGVVRLIARSDTAFVAALDGPAAGVGLAWALACDVIVASEEAVLVPAFGRLGLHPEVGRSWTLTRRLGYEGAFVFFAGGRHLTAGEARGRRPRPGGRTPWRAAGGCQPVVRQRRGFAGALARDGQAAPARPPTSPERRRLAPRNSPSPTAFDWLVSRRGPRDAREPRLSGPPKMLEPKPHIVLYDADCGFCKPAVRWLLRLDRRRCLRPIAIQAPRARVYSARCPRRSARVGPPPDPRRNAALRRRRGRAGGGVAARRLGRSAAALTVPVRDRACLPLGRQAPRALRPAPYPYRQPTRPNELVSASARPCREYSNFPSDKGW
jgi:hypothetical protein